MRLTRFDLWWGNTRQVLFLDDPREWRIWETVVWLLPLVMFVFGVVYAVWFHRQPAERKQDVTNAPQLPTSTEQTIPASLPFVCVVCGASFATQRALSGHGNAHRSDNGHERVKEIESELRNQD